MVHLVHSDVASYAVALTARAAALLEHQEHPPAVVVNVNEGCGVDVEHDPGLKPLVVAPEPRSGLLALVHFVLDAVVCDSVHQLAHRPGTKHLMSMNVFDIFFPHTDKTINVMLLYNSTYTGYLNLVSFSPLT